MPSLLLSVKTLPLIALVLGISAKLFAGEAAPTGKTIPAISLGVTAGSVAVPGVPPLLTVPGMVLPFTVFAGCGNDW